MSVFADFTPEHAAYAAVLCLAALAAAAVLGYAVATGVAAAWALHDCAMNEEDDEKRLYWTWFIRSNRAFGAWVYLLSRRPERVRRRGR